MTFVHILHILYIRLPPHTWRRGIPTSSRAGWAGTSSRVPEGSCCTDRPTARSPQAGTLCPAARRMFSAAFTSAWPHPARSKTAGLLRAALRNASSRRRHPLSWMARFGPDFRRTCLPGPRRCPGRSGSCRWCAAPPGPPRRDEPSHRPWRRADRGTRRYWWWQPPPHHGPPSTGVPAWCSEVGSPSSTGKDTNRRPPWRITVADRTVPPVGRERRNPTRPISGGLARPHSRTTTSPSPSQGGSGPRWSGTPENSRTGDPSIRSSPGRASGPTAEAGFCAARTPISSLCRLGCSSLPPACTPSDSSQRGQSPESSLTPP